MPRRPTDLIKLERTISTPINSGRMQRPNGGPQIGDICYGLRIRRTERGDNGYCFFLPDFPNGTSGGNEYGWDIHGFRVVQEIGGVILS